MFFERLRSANRPLSVRLTLWHSLVFLASSLALLALTYTLLGKRAAATERDAIEFRLYQFASQYQSGGVAGVRQLAALRKGRAQKAFFVRVVDAQARVAFLRDAEDWSEFPTEDVTQPPWPAFGEQKWQVFHSPNDTELLLAAQRLPDGGLLQVGKSNEELRDLLAEYRRSSLLVLLILTPASFAGGAFLASRALRPVKQLTGVAQEIVETSRFSARVPAPGSQDELDALVQVFNKMIGRIEVLMREMRDSIDNVAHDLRTPVTRLRHKAQSAIEASQEAGEDGPCLQCNANLDALADCVEEADRVASMLNTLMDIAEAEAGLVKLNATALSVAELVERTVESYTELAEDRGVAITCAIPPTFRVCADELAVSRVFANVLDNAIKYTPSGGRVTITATQTAGMVTICFADTGVGISTEDLPRIWERLFRGDKSRSERGLGLGLSFVRAIVQAHGGTAMAEHVPSGGTAIRLALPMA